MLFTSAVTGAITLFASGAIAQPTARQAPGAYANLLVFNSAEHSQTPVQIPLSQLYSANYNITKLQLESLTVDIPGMPTPDIEDVVCQRYKDKYGLQPGSATFTKGKPALVDTEPVPFDYVMCYVTSSSS